MAKKTSKRTAPVAEVVRSQDELETAISRLGEFQRQKRELEADYGRDIAKLKEDLGKNAGTLNDKIIAVSMGIKNYADKNRARLFSDDSKTAKFAVGVISYRDKPDAVSLPKNAANKIMMALKLFEAFAGLAEKFQSAFLRLKVEVNKEAILKQREIAEEKLQETGVKIKPGKEQFYIKPAQEEVELEVLESA